MVVAPHYQDYPDARDTEVGTLQGVQACIWHGIDGFLVIVELAE